MEIISIFIADAWGGFDFNNDERWAPGRAFKGGKNAYLITPSGEKVELSSKWGCVVDVAACMNIIPRIWGELDWIEAVNHVHLHELSHACHDGNLEQYEYDGYSHSYHWGKVLIPLSRFKQTKRMDEK